MRGAWHDAGGDDPAEANPIVPWVPELRQERAFKLGSWVRPISIVPEASAFRKAFRGI